MRLVTIAVVLVFAIVGAGCGGDDETSDTTETVVTDTTTTDDTTTDETTTEETDGLGDLASGECQELVAASASFSQAIGSAGASTDLDDVSAVFDELADSAPEEIRADFQVLAEAYTAYADVLGDVQVEPGEVPDAEALAALQQAIASIDQAEVAAASQRISTWATANC